MSEQLSVSKNEECHIVSNRLSKEDFYIHINIENLKAKYGSMRDNVAYLTEKYDNTPLSDFFKIVNTHSEFLNKIDNAEIKTCQSVSHGCDSRVPECAGRGPTHCGSHGGVIEYYCGSGGNIPDYCGCYYEGC